MSNLVDAIENFVDDLQVVVNGDIAFVVDQSGYMTEDENYGVHVVFPASYLKEGRPGTVEFIPEIYVIGKMDFYLKDEFPNFYKLPGKEIEEIRKYGFNVWPDVLRKMGHDDIADDLLDDCNLFNSDAKYEPMTDQELDTHRTVSERVEKYKKAFAECILEIAKEIEEMEELSRNEAEREA